MSLPRKPRPLFNATLPVAQVAIQYHPMRRSEEKILLMAKSAAQNAAALNQNEMIEILPAIKAVVDSCIAETSKAKLPQGISMTDLEWLFIQIRIASVADTVAVTYHDNGDDKDYRFEIKLNDIKVQIPEVKPHIDLGDGLVLQMKYPSAMLYADKAFIGLNDEDQTDALIVACMDKVWEGDKVTAVDSVSAQEALDFINDLTNENMQKVSQFLEAIPRLHYSINYKNTKGEEREITLNTLTDFFTFV